MNKLYLFLSVLLISTSAISQTSSITIFSEDNNPFYVFLNNVRQNEIADTNIRIDGLTNPYYDAKIVFENPTIPNIEKNTLPAVDVDGNLGDVTYKIKQRNNGKLAIRFFTFVPYTSNPFINDNVTIVSYNTNPLPSITTTTTTQTTTLNGPGDNVNVGVNVGGVSIGMDVNVNNGVSTTTTTTQTTTTGVSSGVVVVDEGCYAMRPSDFNQALASIEEKTFSDSKLTLAKQVVKNNCLTAGQIKRIVTLFDFESTKLEFAKFAFPFCYNPENYWKINDAFDYESSIEELNQFIED